MSHNSVTGDPNHLFTLRVRAYRGEPLIVVHAFDGNFQAPNHNRIDVEVRQGGKVIFPRGATYCGLPQGTCIDGPEARESVLHLIGMQPGDTDSEYFDSYTPEQIEWARKYGEEISMIRHFRYCDPETGYCR